jgi:EAL domain-containing protein (putative c-di-GMP-specific phosphodiesterase class I)
MIRPDEFIPMAEQTGIIKLLTRWVFKEAIRLQIALREQGYDLSMAINVSAMNLKEKDLLTFLKTQLSEFPIEPEKLYLEVTETSMMANPKAAMATLAKIRQMGLKVSVDDFGAGYSSLSYLKDLPANEIKIDKSLAQSVSDNERGESVVKTAVKMCHELGFDVVAEGVETQEMLDHLAALECDLVQGYLLTPPLPMNRLVEWLEEQNTTGRFAF